MSKNGRGRHEEECERGNRKGMKEVGVERDWKAGEMKLVGEGWEVRDVGWVMAEREMKERERGEERAGGGMRDDGKGMRGDRWWGGGGGRLGARSWVGASEPPWSPAAFRALYPSIPPLSPQAHTHTHTHTHTHRTSCKISPKVVQQLLMALSLSPHDNQRDGVHGSWQEVGARGHPDFVGGHGYSSGGRKGCQSQTRWGGPQGGPSLAGKVRHRQEWKDQPSKVERWSRDPEGGKAAAPDRVGGGTRSGAGQESGRLGWGCAPGPVSRHLGCEPSESW